MIQKSLPGKVLLFGEYGILHQGVGLACTTHAELTCTISEHDQEEIKLTSFLLPEPQTIEFETKQITGDEIYFLMRFIAHFNLPLKSCHLHFERGPLPGQGQGSSAAYRLLCALLYLEWIQAPLKIIEIIDFCIEDQKRKQGGASSGYEYYTLLYKGVLLFNAYKSEESSNIPSIHFDRIERVRLNASHELFPILYGNNQDSEVKTADWMALQNPFVKKNLTALMSLQAENLEAFLEGDKEMFMKTQLTLNDIFSPSPGWQAVYQLQQLQQLPGYGKQWTFKPLGAGGLETLAFFGDTTAISEHFAASGLAPFPYALNPWYPTITRTPTS